MTPDEIMESDLPEQATEQLYGTLEGFEFTTHALWAIGYWLRTQGDIRGAKLVDGFVAEFAAHEARRGGRHTTPSPPPSARHAVPPPALSRGPEGARGRGGILDDRSILKVAAELAGGRRRRVYLADLRAAIGGSRAEQDQAFNRLMDSGDAVLYRLDDIAAKSHDADRKHIESGLLQVGGHPRHILMVY